jgi:hypothetical protein
MVPMNFTVFSYTFVSMGALKINSLQRDENQSGTARVSFLRFHLIDGRKTNIQEKFTPYP